jgi:hypothetical protein
MELIKVFIPLNQKNKNGRIYTKEMLGPHVQDFLDRLKLLGVVYGELDHPQIFDTSLSRVSHTISNIWFDGNQLKGEIKLLDTYYGKVLQSLIKDNLEFSVRPRSIGTIDKNGYVHLKKLLTFDVISSDKDAFFGTNELRKLKLNKLSKKMEEQEFLTESYDDRYDVEEELPRFEEDFHILKNNYLINE